MPVFLKNPPILVLDKATAALDATGERPVQEAVAAARADRTVILAAQRLYTVADADRRQDRTMPLSFHSLRRGVR